MTEGAPPDAGLGRFASRLLLAAMLVGVALFLGRITTVLLLVFAAALLAVLLRGLARAVERRTRLSARWSLVTTIVALLGLLGLAGWLLGSRVAAEAARLGEMLPAAWDQVSAWLERFAWGRSLVDTLEGLEPGDVPERVVRRAGSAVVAAAGMVGHLLLLFAGSLYLAAQPGLYRRGLLALVPRRYEARAAEVLDAIGDALWQWLKGQLLAMALVGAATTLGLWALGVPSPLALGILAGLGEFVPLVGAVATAIPALLAAFSEGPSTALYTLGLYVAIQQLEGNVLMPVVGRKMVSLPPALTLFAVVALGLAFGLAGVLLATPLTVVAFVAVRKVYVEDALGKRLGEV